MNTTNPATTTNDRGETEHLWIGVDDRGVELEVAAVEVTDDDSGDAVLLVLHVMPTQYRK